MRISELSRRSGIPLPSIKFFLREGLLPPGVAKGVNQADYGQAHLDRLALIRVLQDVGGMSLQTVRSVLAVLDAPSGEGSGSSLGAAMDALGSPVRIGRSEPQDVERAAEDVDALLRTLGWSSRPDSSARLALVEAVAALRRVCLPGMPIETLMPYVQATMALAEFEIASTSGELAGPSSEAMQAAVLGTVLWEPVILALRRMAHEELTLRLLQPERG